MQLIADILLASGAVAAAFYCMVLSKRLKNFNSLDKGVGGAVAVLSTQVEDLKRTLEAAQRTAAESSEGLSDLQMRAEETSKRLEVQMAALQDVVVEEASTKEREPGGTTEAVTQPLKADEGEPMFIRHAAGAG